MTISEIKYQFIKETQPWNLKHFKKETWEERDDRIKRLMEVELKKHKKNMSQEKEKGLRFNEGKTRHDLVPAFAQEQYAKVLTKGAEKYEERNWEKGMDWSKVLASLKRHINRFERGEDFDKETGLLHMAHVMCNAGFLVEYYKIHPSGDDRPNKHLKFPKVGFDIDEVLCDFIGGFYSHFNISLEDFEKSCFWSDHIINQIFEQIKNDEDFWLNLPIKVTPNQLPIEPHCYITSRSINSEVTKKWLVLRGFPDRPVYTVGVNGSKVEIAKSSGIDFFIDDRYKNFVELNNAGINCFLMDAPHNRRYNVGYKRIKDINKLLDYII